MTTESTDWLTRHVRAKREAENIGEGEGYPFMTWKDAQSLEHFFGEGAKVVGHGLLVAKDGQTLAFMRLLGAEGSGAATGGEPAASATTPAPATPAQPSQAPAAPAPAAPAPTPTAPSPPPSSGVGAHSGEVGGGKPVSPLADPGKKYEIGKGIVDFFDPAKQAGKIFDSMQRNDKRLGELPNE